uniref:Uncharacterized protein n=1 Tax=Arundo donax TaxID=35708 RepID=A0A0A9GZT6_ARUDO
MASRHLISSTGDVHVLQIHRRRQSLRGSCESLRSCSAWAWLLNSIT